MRGTCRFQNPTAGVPTAVPIAVAHQVDLLTINPMPPFGGTRIIARLFRDDPKESTSRESSGFAGSERVVVKQDNYRKTAYVRVSR